MFKALLRTFAAAGALLAVLAGPADAQTSPILNIPTLPTIATASGYGLPTSPETLAGLAATQTLTNKTFVAPALGAATATSLLETSAASINETFAGVSVNFVNYQAATAASASLAESGGYFGITSSAGAANLTSAYKNALTAEATCNSGSSSCWGLVNLVTLGSGGSLRGGIGFESDLNNNQSSSYPTAPANPYGVNFYATGSPTGAINNTAFLADVAVGPMWHQGFAVVGTNTVDTAAFEDMSTGAPTSFLGLNGLLVGTISESRRALVHAYAAANNLQIEAVLENDQAGSGVAALGFSVTGTGASETRSTKAGIGFQRNAGNGRGVMLLYNRGTNDANDFTSSDIVANIASSGNLTLAKTATPGAQLLTLDTGGSVAWMDASGTGSVDTGCSRVAALVVGCGNGMPGDITATLKVGAIAIHGTLSGFTAPVLTIDQAANNDDTIAIARATDTSPTGNIMRVVNAAANTNLFTLDVKGGVISAAQIESVLAGSGSGSSFLSSSAVPSYALQQGAGGTDQKVWDIVSTSATNLSFRTVNDAASGAVTWLSVLRGTGTAVTNITFGAPIIGGAATFSGTLTLAGGILLATSATLTNGAAAQVATMTNGPTAGNPTKWIPINDNGTTRYIPAW